MFQPTVTRGDTITIYGLIDAQTYTGQLVKKVNPLYWEANVQGESWMVSWSDTDARWEGGKSE